MKTGNEVELLPIKIFAVCVPRADICEKALGDSE